MAYLPTGEVDHFTVGSGETARVTDLTYDDLHRLRTVTDAEGFAVTYDYDGTGPDSANRLTTITLPDLETVSFDHDAMGNIVSVTPPGRPAQTFTYTKRNQLESYTLPDVGDGVAVESREYDDDRRLRRITRPDGLIIEYDYEPYRNRLETLTTPRGDSTFTYQDDGKLDTITTFDGQTLDFTYHGPLLTRAEWTGTVAGSVEHTYDTSLRLESLAVNGADPVTYVYDDDSLLLAAGALGLSLDPDSGRPDAATLDQVTTEWTYTPFGEIESMTTRFGESVIFEESFVYDKRGWITDLTRTQGGNTVLETYGYDSRGRLESVHQDGQPRSSNTYDANSNRTSYTGPFPNVTTTVYDARDRLLQSGDVTYTYSEAGELTSKSANDHTISYDYDVLGNLRQVVLDTGITIDYVIDPAGRRIGKKIEGQMVKGWLYQNGLSPIAELDGAGNLVSRFVYGTRAHVPDYMVRDGITYRIVSDRLGSPRVVVNVSTGAVAQELRYDEFGRITLDTNPGFQPFGFAGGLYDEQTGLLRMGARDYNPEIGRWTTPDPIGFRSGDTNLYNYAGSNPVVWADPLGLSLVDGLWGFAKGAVVGLAVGAGAAAIVATAPAAGTALAVAGAISLATAYYEGVAAYYDPNVSEDQMHEFIGEVAGAVVGCVAGFKVVRGPGGTTTGLLARSEAAGGHLMARHVGLTSPQLSARLAGNARLRAASTFESAAQAESAVTGVLEAGASQMSAWVSAGARGRLVINAPFSGGSVLVRGASGPVSGTGVRVVLQGNGSGEWHILTGFPTP